MPTGPIPLLLCSIGNPSSAYANTLHSAGHTLLKSLHLLTGTYTPWRPYLKGELATPADTKKFSITGFKNTLNEHDATLWMSGSLMNISGPGVKRVWDGWRGVEGREGRGARLVVVHDELEKELGVVGVKLDGRSSAKGHNGIKSIQQSLAGSPFIRIGVGIGRPEGREPNVVANYVLRKMTPREKAKIEDAAGKVLSIINDLKYGTYK